MGEKTAPPEACAPRRGNVFPDCILLAGEMLTATFIGYLFLGVGLSLLLGPDPHPVFPWLLFCAVAGLGALASAKCRPRRGPARGACAAALLLGLELLLVQTTPWRPIPLGDSPVALSVLMGAGLIGFAGATGWAGSWLARHDLRAWWRAELEEFCESIRLRR